MFIPHPILGADSFTDRPQTGHRFAVCLLFTGAIQPLSVCTSRRPTARQPVGRYSLGLDGSSFHRGKRNNAGPRSTTCDVVVLPPRVRCLHRSRLVVNAHQPAFNKLAAVITVTADMMKRTDTAHPEFPGVPGAVVF